MPHASRRQLWQRAGKKSQKGGYRERFAGAENRKLAILVARVRQQLCELLVASHLLGLFIDQACEHPVSGTQRPGLFQLAVIVDANHRGPVIRICESETQFPLRQLHHLPSNTPSTEYLHSLKKSSNGSQGEEPMLPSDGGAPSCYSGWWLAACGWRARACPFPCSKPSATIAAKAVAALQGARSALTVAYVVTKTDAHICPVRSRLRL